MKLFLYEVRRILTVKNIFLIAAAFILQIALGLNFGYYEHEYSREVYKKYLADIGGTYTQEKKKAIEDRYEEISLLIASRDAMEDAYTHDKISQEEFQEFNYEYYRAAAESATVEYLVKKCSYFDAIDGEAVFFYDTDWEDFLSHTDYNYIVAVVVFLLVIPVFDNDYDSGSRITVLTTKKGRRELCAVKISAAVFIAFAVSFSLFMLRYAAFSYAHGANAGLSVRNIMEHSEYNDISIMRYCLTDSLLKSAAWAVGAIAICAVANIVRNTVFTFFLSFIVMLCPALFSRLFSFRLYPYIFCADNLNGMYAASLSIAALAGVYVCKAVAYWVLNMYFWGKE